MLTACFAASQVPGNAQPSRGYRAAAGVNRTPDTGVCTQSQSSWPMEKRSFHAVSGAAEQLPRTPPLISLSERFLM
jgi:hypothetical protein